ncbi:odorant receptor 9a-like [Venturia canescens]|uniref:odorant receptor 9a-like n=1 Tax=Venturia canescens TaxID=32260 RepID=UPI001C9CFF99|nr:odorant receptor 9a-like [Venturia canescens]
MASFFDHPYYKWNKTAMTIIGTWPGQPFLLRLLIPIFICSSMLCLIVPEIVYLKITWLDIDALLDWVPPISILTLTMTQLLNGSFHPEKISAILEHISSDWKDFRDARDVEVLEKYAAHGFWITKTYYRAMTVMVSCYAIMPFLMPVALQYFVPSNNGSSGKIYLFNAYYGVDSDDYYYFILAHMILETAVSSVVMVANDALYFVFIEHSCALFKIVEVNLERICSLRGHTKDPEEDESFNVTCYCINLHQKAIFFTVLIDSAYNGPLLVIIGTSLLSLSVAELQMLMHLDKPGELIRFGLFAISQILRLYLLSISGQKIMDYSSSIFHYVYSVNWHDLSPRVQKLFVVMMIRSLRPCYVSAGKMYTITMENYSAILRTSMSFFTVLSSLR